MRTTRSHIALNLAGLSSCRSDSLAMRKLSTLQKEHSQVIEESGLLFDSYLIGIIFHQMLLQLCLLSV